MGQVVLHQDITGKENMVVNASNWKTGTYIISITTESGKVIRKKVMIQ